MINKILLEQFSLFEVWNPQNRESLTFPFSGLVWKMIFRTEISSDSIRGGWDCKIQSSDVEYIHCQCRFVTTLFSLFCLDRISPGSGVLGWCHPAMYGLLFHTQRGGIIPHHVFGIICLEWDLSAWTGQRFCTHTNVSCHHSWNCWLVLLCF